jgi:S-adenosylmethionine:tRNA ribosyltransferase-isomerase
MFCFFLLIAKSVYFAQKYDFVSQSENINIKDFNYFLPDEKIAKYPLELRDKSKLLVSRNNRITDDVFANIGNYIPQGSLLFRNNTRVIHARLIFQKKTGARIEIFCLSPADPVEYQLSFSQTKTCNWNCIVGNLKKWKEEILELQVQFDELQIILKAEKIGFRKDKVKIRFCWDGEISFGKLLDHIGNVPIPPYLHRESEQIDNERYQTVYSHFDGSVAAPTAGLHFTPFIFENLEIKNILPLDITLHVGAGTFQPVKVTNAMDHKMHIEYFSVDSSVIRRLAEDYESIVSTGTTTLRTLESLYWLALKSMQTGKIQDQLDQWENNYLPQNISMQSAFSGLLELMKKEKTETIIAGTGIMIVPGYQFRVADALITNFHQPQSTLLLLIAAFIGEQWKDIYNHAMSNNYRFLSYGDSSILWH